MILSLLPHCSLCDILIASIPRGTKNPIEAHSRNPCTLISNASLSWLNCNSQRPIGTTVSHFKILHKMYKLNRTEPEVPFDWGRLRRVTQNATSSNSHTTLVLFIISLISWCMLPCEWCGCWCCGCGCCPFFPVLDTSRRDEEETGERTESTWSELTAFFKIGENKQNLSISPVSLLKIYQQCVPFLPTYMGNN